MDVKTKRWYIKLFWHLADVAKVNAWNLYSRHSKQLGISSKEIRSLMDFTLEIAEALICCNKQERRSVGGPSKRKSTDVKPGGKRPTVPLPCADVRYDGMHHWPELNSSKQRCQLCQSYVRMKCKKCNNVYLCLQSDRNCFRSFDQK